MNTTTEAFIFGFVKQCHALNIDVETTVALLEAVQTKELYANESFQKGFCIRRNESRICVETPRQVCIVQRSLDAIQSRMDRAISALVFDGE